MTKMTDKTLRQRIATAISTAPPGETYADCRDNEAKAALEEITSWVEETFNSSFVTAVELRNEVNK